MQENYIVGIYARLSRDDERAGESVSIENQKEMLSRYVREQGWTLYDYYCDDGVSGTTFDRPGLNRLVQDATDHKINLVLCKDLSRLGRDYIEAGKYTDFVFPSLGCRFIALNDGVDTLRKNNEMLVILKNVMNDLYARDTSSKIKAVKLSTFKSGKYVGCYAPLGYRKSEADKHVLEIDPVTAPVVRLPQDRLAAQRGKSPCAKELLLHGGGAGKSAWRDTVLERCDGQNHSPQ